MPYSIDEWRKLIREVEIEKVITPWNSFSPLSIMMDAKTRPEWVRIIIEIPKLLTMDSQISQVLYMEMVVASDEEDREHIRQIKRVRQFLSLCREEIITNGKELSSRADLEKFFISRPNLGAQFDIPTELDAFGSGLMDYDNVLEFIQSRLLQAEEAANISQLAKMYRQALNFIDRAENAQVWASFQLQLGNCLMQLPLGDRAENIEDAIKAYQHASEVLSRKGWPEYWAKTMMNLGSAYAQRILGNPTENIYQAKAFYDEASSVLKRESTPIEWAQLMLNLGNIYRVLIFEDIEENIQRSIGYYQQALEVITIETMPIEWATIQMNLANSYRSINKDQAENTEHAIELYNQALNVFTPQSTPFQWVSTMNNLAHCYKERVLGNKADNIEQSIKIFSQTLEIQAPNWLKAQVMSNLGEAYKKRIKGNLEENKKQAVKVHEQAVDLLCADSPSLARSQAVIKLGDLHFSQSEWQSAYQAYTKSVSVADTLHRSSSIYGSRKIVINTTADWYDRIITTCLRLPMETEYARAGLVYAEASRARTFLEQMSQASITLPSNVSPELLKREHELRSQLDRLTQVLEKYPNFLSMSKLDPEKRPLEIFSNINPDKFYDIQEWDPSIIKNKLEQVWDEVLRMYPNANDYVNFRRAETLDWAELANLSSYLGPSTALVEFYTLENEIAVYILRDGWEAPYVFSLPISRQKLNYRYASSYVDEVLTSRKHRRPQYNWLGLGEELLAPIESFLDGVSLVYFIPHGILHAFPLHALTVNGDAFITRYAVAYAPSSAILKRIFERDAIREKKKTALVMGFTAKNSEQELFLSEADAIAAHLGTKRFPQANIQSLRKHAETSGCIHLSCHGYFDTTDPLASGVQLADGNFTARDWMALNIQADLVTLSACQTGINKIGLGDEISGLTRSLLYAGSSSALLTLWQVDAPSTREWMLDFYNRVWDESTHEKQQAKALAFQQATLALRENHSDPYYWAPFILVGNWN